MDLISSDIESLTHDLCKAIQSMSLSQQIEALNMVRRSLHEISPFKAEPVDFVEWVPSETVVANDYNPNTVAPPEMRLLKLSIREDGFTQPIVTYPQEAVHEVVDGFHRTTVGTTDKQTRTRLHGHVPIVNIRSSASNRYSRQASTVRHNRARGVHGVVPMVDLVKEMLQTGATDDEVSTALGMDADEILRFKQNTGLPALFKNTEYSKAWE